MPTFGEIEKRGKTYRVRYRDPSYTLPGPKPRITAPVRFRTKNEAQIYLANIQTQIATGTWQHPREIAAQQATQQAQAEITQLTELRQSITLAQYAKTWLEQGKTQWAPATYRRRKSNLNAHILPALGASRLTDLTQGHILAWYNSLPTDGVKANCYKTLRALAACAVNDSETALEVSPVRIRGGGKERKVRGERHLLTWGEVEKIAEVIRPQVRALVFLVADSGLRINEALALQRNDFVTDAQGMTYVRVRRALTRMDAGVIGVKELKSADRVSERRVYLTDRTVREMRAHLDMYAGDRAHAVVFPRTRYAGNYCASQVVGRWLAQAAREAGISLRVGEYLGWHAFRHFSATMYGQAGASVAALMQRYGWATPAQAMAYQRADAEYDRMLTQRMEQLRQ